MNPMKAIAQYGQSVWLDYIRRDLITGGDLKRLIQDDGLRGVTSNPSIFEKAITGSNDYEEFFKGLFETALTPRDMLAAIRVPAASADSRVGFAEFARRHGDYAMVGLAACAQADGKRLKNLRLAFFGVAATPVRARSAETALAEGDVEAAVSALDADLEPSDDMHASSEVKSHLAGVLLRRVARQLGRAPS